MSDKFEWDKKKIVTSVLFLLIVVISVVVLLMIILDETFLFRIIRNYFIIPLVDIGFWAVFIFLFLMILQSLIAPIPSEIILLSGAMIFGFWGGVVLGFIGSILSAIITYYISNKGGRTILEATGQKIGLVDRMVLFMDEWINKWGIWAIIIGRAVPVIMFDPVSYAAGISNIKWKPYLLATAIGSIPRAIFFSILGVQMLGNKKPLEIANMSSAEFDNAAGQFNLIFFVIFGVLCLMLVLANVLSYLREKKLKQQQERKQEQLKL